MRVDVLPLAPTDVEELTVPNETDGPLETGTVVGCEVAASVPALDSLGATVSDSTAVVFE